MRKLILGAASLLLGVALVAPLAVGKDAAIDVGAAAPAFELQDHNGKNVKLADFKDKIVVLEWIHPGCPFVVKHYDAKTMTTLANKYAEKGIVWLAINSTKDVKNDENKKWADKYEVKYPILNDGDGKTGHAYGATNTPHMYIVGKDGKLAYIGAIDDDASMKKADKTNYVQKALDELLEGKAVSTPKTKAYGCSVKFKT
ncbi:MAG: redoxin domain-containing protein [Planctomycetota bacterium]